MSRRRTTTPADFARLGFAAWYLAAESSAVVGMRMLGLAGFWSTRPDEALRMFAEKPAAMQQAALAGASAAWSGKRPDQIAAAAMAPLARKARQNRKRLTKAGPRRPGEAG